MSCKHEPLSREDTGLRDPCIGESRGEIEGRHILLKMMNSSLVQMNQTSSRDISFTAEETLGIGVVMGNIPSWSRAAACPDFLP